MDVHVSTQQQRNAATAFLLCVGHLAPTLSPPHGTRQRLLMLPAQHYQGACVPGRHTAWHMCRFICAQVQRTQSGSNGISPEDRRLSGVHHEYHATNQALSLSSVICEGHYSLCSPKAACAILSRMATATGHRDRESAPYASNKHDIWLADLRIVNMRPLPKHTKATIRNNVVAICTPIVQTHALGGSMPGLWHCQQRLLTPQQVASAAGTATLDATSDVSTAAAAESAAARGRPTPRSA